MKLIGYFSTLFLSLLIVLPCQLVLADDALWGRYQTTVINTHPHVMAVDKKPATQRYQWDLWRTDDSVEFKTQNGGERWASNEHLLTRELLDHQQQFKLMFHPADLRLTTDDDIWYRQQHLIAKGMLQQLQLVGYEQSNGKKSNDKKSNGEQSRSDHPVALYEGQWQGQSVQLQWDEVSQLPVRLEQRSQYQTLIVERLQLDSLAKQPPINSSAYQDMDYADIGDSEASEELAQAQKSKVWEKSAWKY